MLCVLLDVDKNGVIDLDEFVNGCMQLHGPAKSLQMAKMGYENKCLAGNYDEVIDNWEWLLR